VRWGEGGGEGGVGGGGGGGGGGAGGGDLIGVLVPGSVGRGTASGADLDHDQHAAVKRLSQRLRLFYGCFLVIEPLGGVPVCQQ